MRQSIWVGLIAVSALALTVNCGGGDDDDDTGGSDGGAGASNTDEPVMCPTSITNVSQSLSEAICARRTECCEDDQDTCQSEVTAALDAIYPDLNATNKAGTASLDCDAFDACALAIHRASCDEWPLQTGELGGLPVDEAACLAIITPTIDDGDDCRYNYECVNGLCRVPEDETEGTCSEFARLGASCEDKVCDPTTMFCNESQVCETRLSDGATCTSSSQCKSRLCDADEGDEESKGECIAPGPEECAYVPNGAAHCAIGHGPGSSSTPYGLLAATLAGLWASGARRRRARC